MNKGNSSITLFNIHERGAKYTREPFKLIDRKETEKAMVKKEKDRYTIKHNTQHIKLKTKQHEPHQKLGSSQVLMIGKSHL